MGVWASCGSAGAADGAGVGGVGFLVPIQYQESGQNGGFSGDPVHFRRFSGWQRDCGESLDFQRISWSRWSGLNRRPAHYECGGDVGNTMGPEGCNQFVTTFDLRAAQCSVMHLHAEISVIKEGVASPL